MAQKKTSKKESTVKYENNPFFIAANGITRLFDLARGVAILLLSLSILSLLFNRMPSDSNTAEPKSWGEFTAPVASWTANEWILAGGSVVIIGMALLMISSLFSAVSSYSAWKLSKGDTVNVGEAFHVAFDNIWEFIWLQIIIFIKIVLWSLLFVIPGIYFAFRYTLAGVAFFDEKKNLRGNAAIKESLRLTKGAWLTTFSSNVLFNILTFGILSPVIATGVNTTLYAQFNALGNKPKPTAHWLTWATFILPIILLFFALSIVLAIITGIAVGMISSTP